MNRKCGYSVATHDKRTVANHLGADKDKMIRDQTLGVLEHQHGSRDVM